MKITVEKQPKSQLKLTIELTQEQSQKYFEQAAKQVSAVVKVPGFRPGHAPLDQLIKHVPQEKIEMHMLDIALPEVYSKAILQEKIQAVSRPKINIISVRPFKFEATVAIYPEVKITGYDKIKTKKNEVKVEDKEIDQVLDEVRRSRATHKEVDRPAQKGDKVEINFEGFDEGGAALENTKSTNHPLVLGDNTLIPGFEDQLIGLKKDEKKSFHITFPKDYFHKKFQNKKVEFKVEVKRVEQIELPQFTPEFLKEIAGSDKSLDEIKATIKENIQHDKEHQEKVRRENELLEKIIELTKVELPEQLVEEEIDGIIDEFKNDLERKGITLDKFLEANKKELKDLREQHRKEAEHRLILRFGLNNIFEQEKYVVTPEQLQKEIEHIIALYPEKEREKISKEYSEGSYLLRRLENKLKMEKLFESLLHE